MTNVDVCNEALGRIGQGASRPIQALTEDSESARACNRVFMPAMRRMLREYRWPWAQVVSPLAPVGQTVPGWLYVYEHPADCLYLHSVVPDGYDPTQYPESEGPARWRVFRGADAQSHVIAANVPDAVGWYTADVEDAAFADDHFRDALAWRVAAEIALGLKADPTMAQNASQQYELAVQTAVSLVTNQPPRQPRAIPQNMLVRGVPWSAR